MCLSFDIGLMCEFLGVRLLLMKVLLFMLSCEMSVFRMIVLFSSSIGGSMSVLMLSINCLGEKLLSVCWF